MRRSMNHAYLRRGVFVAFALVLSSIASVVRCDMLEPNRPPVDYFLVLVATLIGLSIGMALPFFIELSRKDIPAAPGIADHKGTKKFLNGDKYDDALVNAIAKRDSVKVNCLGERFFEIPITNATTCGDVIGELKAMLDLSTGLNEYGLFVRVGTKADVRMDDEIIVHAVMIHVESGLYDGKENMDAGDDTASSEPTTDFQFVFNVFSFANSQASTGMAVSYSIVEEDFMFEKACDQVFRRRLPCSNHTLARLAGLRCQCIFGDYQAGSDIPEKPSVHPVQYDQLHNPQPPPLTHDKQHAKVKRRAKVGKLPSASHRKMNKIEYEQVMASIKVEWATLTGLSTDDARTSFMDVIAEWPYYQHQIFDVKQLCFPEWPKDVWFLVGPETVSFHDVHGRTPLASYTYSDVHSFGAPVAQRYNIQLIGKSIEFETKRVQEIAKLMKTYITYLTENYRK